MIQEDCFFFRIFENLFCFNFNIKGGQLEAELLEEPFVLAQLVSETEN